MQGRRLLVLAGLVTLLAAPRAEAVLLFEGGPSEGNGNGIEVTIRVLANDFQLAERSTVESVEVWAQVGAEWDGTLEYFFFEPSGNLPAMVPLATGIGTNVTTSPGGVAQELIYRFDLAAPVVLEGGQQYWFGLHMKQSYADDGNYAFWSTTTLDFGDTSRSAEGGNFAAWAIPPDDEAFRLHGEVPEPAPSLLALAGALVLLAVRAVRSRPRSRAAGVAAALGLASFASAPAEAHGKKYFLTVDEFTANQAKEACGKGYHMASLWEIFDPTDLRYDAKRGQTNADSGSGPPSGEIGWIRTGFSSNQIGGPGSGNCNSWNSFMVLDFGSTAALSAEWDGAGVSAGPWTTSTSSCVAGLPVWCKQN